MTDAASSSRRSFLRTAATTAAAAVSAPMILRASDKSGRQLPRLGTGAYQYEAIHGWGELPDHLQWTDTHGVAVDSEGLIYIKHRGDRTKAPMDTVAVFDADGKFVRSFGKEYHSGGHGIDIRREGSDEYLYLSTTWIMNGDDRLPGNVVKTNLRGEVVWRLDRPDELEPYKDPVAPFHPTNVCFGPDNGLYIGDGYGSNVLLQYDKNGKHVRTFGGLGDGPGQVKTPHGQWLDDRPGRDPMIIVADRANARLQYFTLEGEHGGFIPGMSFPADVDIQGDIMLVPDLHARVTLLDKDNALITHLGYDEEWTKKVLDGFKMRGQPDTWEAGRFIHPHDACFDRDSNIFVVEWVASGRVTKLRKA